MSNFLAIATVTATLQKLLTNAVRANLPGAVSDPDVKTERPDKNMPAKGVNIYLYQVTPNTAWRNADLPTRNAAGQLTQRPQAALDLHYLLTFYGAEDVQEPQRLLGIVVRTLHAQPVLTHKVISEAINQAVLDDPLSFMGHTNLADEVELVKFTPLPLSLEELSKLWSVFLKTEYALSVAYLATVVLIESSAAPRSALPVRARNLYAAPFRQPVIERVVAAAGDEQQIVAGSALAVVGRQLRGEITRVQFAGVGSPTTPSEVSDSRIVVAPPGSLRAGVQALQVVQLLNLGTPPTPHSGVESNVAAFVIRPIVSIPANPVANSTDRVVEGVTLRTADLTLQFSPNVGRQQRVVLLLNEFQAGESAATARAYRFSAEARDAASDPPESATLTIRVVDMEPGPYLVRVQVDGAESQLAPSQGKYTSPQVTI